ncbi:hypothetical protein OESDEN_07977 [Oesophagostomum dentatum]|uniref:SXP/RAL-2 family protein Ani s 5-like cation-binding domain-containing protein n=1 Tax=Oesophagostomum dentatum TaxID=61180 RepID=A0A0B1T9Y7_OESDE|nr:hypothetical protein OESDEN_07977 [Oesophagostomum dentatum]
MRTILLLIAIVGAVLCESSKKTPTVAKADGKSSAQKLPVVGKKDPLEARKKMVRANVRRIIAKLNDAYVNVTSILDNTKLTPVQRHQEVKKLVATDRTLYNALKLIFKISTPQKNRIHRGRWTYRPSSRRPTRKNVLSDRRRKLFGQSSRSFRGKEGQRKRVTRLPSPRRTSVGPVGAKKGLPLAVTSNVTSKLHYEIPTALFSDTPTEA